MSTRLAGMLILAAWACGCGGGPEGGSALPARLGAGSVTSSATELLGKKYYIYEVTLRVERCGGGGLPEAARDMFAGIVYLSGPAATEEVAREVSSSVSWSGLPSDSLSVRGADGVTRVDLLFEEDVLDLGAMDGLAAKGTAETFCLAILAGPKDRATPWDLATTTEVRFLIKGFSLGGSGLLGGPSAEGVAAVWLCGFEKSASGSPGLVRLSEPFFLVLRPSQEPGG